MPPAADELQCVGVGAKSWPVVYAASRRPRYAWEEVPVQVSSGHSIHTGHSHPVAWACSRGRERFMSFVSVEDFRPPGTSAPTALRPAA